MYQGPPVTEWTIRDDDMEVDPMVVGKWEPLADNMMQSHVGRQHAYEENVETLMNNEQKQRILKTLMRNMMSIPGRRG